MGKNRSSSTTRRKGGIRVRRGDRESGSGVVSVAWKYDNERGQTVWLRPATGLEIGEVRAILVAP